MYTGLLIIFLLVSPIIAGQSNLRIINQYTSKHGLSNSEVYCIEKDDRGFLWLGTKEGLNRFDGFGFKKFYSAKSNPRSLSHNNVFDILEYKTNWLLIATGSGLSVLNTVTGAFENHRVRHPMLQAGSGISINSLFKDRKNNIWVNHSGKIDVLDSNLNHITRVTDLPWARTLEGITIHFEEWYEDSQNRLWLPADTASIQIVDITSQQIFNKKNNPQHLPYLDHSYIRSMLVDEPNHTLWLAPWGQGLLKYDLRTNARQQQNFNLPEWNEKRCVNSLSSLKNNNIFCTIEGKCYEVNANSLHYTEVLPMTGFEHEGPITSICQVDDNGTNYWVGTARGLFQVSNKNYYKAIDLGTSKNACADLLRSSDGMLYTILSNKTLIQTSKTRNDALHYKVPVEGNNSLVQLAEDKAGHIWIGTTWGLWMFDPLTRSFSQPAFLLQELRRSHIDFIFFDSDGELWVSTRASYNLYHYKSGEKKWEHASEKIGDQVGSRSAPISAITENKEGVLWMISNFGGGILSYNKKTGEWKSHPRLTRNYNLLAKKAMMSAYAGEDHDLWLTSYYGDGLIRYDYQKDSISSVTREEGLPSNYIQTMCPDHKGNLLLVTETGISKFTPANFFIRTINIPENNVSLTGSQFTFDPETNSMAVVINNRLLFIPVDSFSLSVHPPLPVIDKITINAIEQFVEPGNGTLTLSSAQKNITVDFTAAEFSNAGKIRFAYMLSGADKDWRYPGENRTAHYSALAPGTYTFIVKAASETGDWNEQYASFSFAIAIPWWQATWFRMAVALSLIVIAFYFVRRRIKNIRKEAAWKQKIAETEMMALRAQMNPHFIFNCINSIDAMIQSNDKYQATIYLNKFAKLIRNILDSSKQNVITLSKDIETLQLYIELEQFRNENKFTAEIRADNSLLQDDYKVPPLIIQPYVENAILHGLKNRPDDKGKLLVSVSRQNGHLEFIVEDNGAGRKATSNKQSDKQSYGMQMTKDRIKFFNKQEDASVTITDLEHDGKAAGTQVRVLLNIQ